MPEIGDIRALYETYFDDTARAERDRKPGQGVLGLKGGPKDAPFHDQFIHDLEELLLAYGEEDHASGEIRQLLEYMFDVPREHRDSHLVYWMTMAVHGLPLPLVDGLTREDAEALYVRYAADYPRWERMPVQKKMLDALKKRAR